MATLFTTSCSFSSSPSWVLKKNPSPSCLPSLSKHPFGQNTQLSFSLSSTPNSKRLVKFLVKAEQENEPSSSSSSSSSSSVAVVSEKPEIEDTQKGGVSGEVELRESEAEEREKQQELDWKTDEEFKKFMGNPSIEAAIKLEKKRADRKLKELDRESSDNPIVGLFNKLVRDNLAREKEMLEQAEETFKALDLNKLRSCFGFDTFFATDVRRFGDGGIFIGNLRKPVEEAIPKLERKLSEAAGTEVVLWLMEEKSNDITKQVCMVQPKAEMDLQFESTKLSTPWGYVSAITLCVATFGTIALMSGFFLKPNATFDDYVSDVVPLFGGFLSILGVSEIATRVTAARYGVKLSPSFLVPSNWTGCLGVMNNYESLLPNKKALFDIPVARTASAYLTSLVLAIAAFVADGSFNGGDNALYIRPQFFYNNPHPNTSCFSRVSPQPAHHRRSSSSSHLLFFFFFFFSSSLFYPPPSPMDELQFSTPQPPPSRSLPFREDCWSEEATSTLVDAWGRRYLDLNRGNLRQKDWQEVADAVNLRHGHTKKTRRTDVQCKNRIDTLKKKYKVEKARVSESNGSVTSSWSFFPRLDYLIGSTAKKAPSPPLAVPLVYRKPPPGLVVQPVVLPQKRPSPAVDDSYFRRNYSAVAAAAAAEEEEETEEEGDEDEVEGMSRLARAIERFGEMYERIEGEKQRQMIELEKQRMQFAKDLEVQRMQLFMDTQVQLEKIKQAKRSGSNDIYS